MKQGANTKTYSLNLQREASGYLLNLQTVSFMTWRTVILIFIHFRSRFCPTVIKANVGCDTSSRKKRDLKIRECKPTKCWCHRENKCNGMLTTISFCWNMCFSFLHRHYTLSATVKRPKCPSHLVFSCKHVAIICWTGFSAVQLEPEAHGAVKQGRRQQPCLGSSFTVYLSPVSFPDTTSSTNFTKKKAEVKPTHVVTHGVRVKRLFAGSSDGLWHGVFFQKCKVHSKNRAEMWGYLVLNCLLFITPTSSLFGIRPIKFSTEVKP